MFSESGSFCFMDMSSNSAVFLSDKDLNGNNMDPDEFGLMVRPAIETHNDECQTSTLEYRHDLITLKQLSVQEQDPEEEEEEDKDHQQRHMKKLKLEIPSYKKDVVGSENNHDSNDGFKTPTSSDHKIPVILECPGAPKKTKSRPAATKRKSCCRRIVLDLSNELESLFPIPSFVVDLGSGGKNKKVKQCSGNEKP